MKRIRQNLTVDYSYEVCFTRDAFGAGAGVLEGLLFPGERRPKVLTVIDAGVLGCDERLAEKVSRFAALHAQRGEFVLPPVILPGGERCKDDRSFVDAIHARVVYHGLCRHSFLLAIGGGAVLDAAGFAAATAHRGIRLIRMPTTALAMNDAGVGVKNGINAFGRKNFTGCFAPPYAVVNDLDFLRLLPERELRCGIAEALKVALIRDRDFFGFLYAARADLAQFDPRVMETVVMRCAELHLEHIRSSGDPFESGSSRPLDFGHWIAHKLEEVTRASVRHGEAVAIGIALDSLYARWSGLMEEADLSRTLAVLTAAGFELYHDALGLIDLEKALREFREHLGGDLSIPLPAGIGNRVDWSDIDLDLYRQCVETLAGQHRAQQQAEESDGQSETDDDRSGTSRSLLPGKPRPAPGDRLVPGPAGPRQAG